jgi:hypothetical protein
MNCCCIPAVFIPLVILLWHKFIYEEISECNVNKYGNCLTFTRQRRSILSSYLAVSSLACVCIAPHLSTAYSRNTICKTLGMVPCHINILYPITRIRDVYHGSRIRLFPSRIPDPNRLHPGSLIRIKEFKYINPKKTKKMVSKL